MSYALSVKVKEAEPYTDLEDEDDVYAAIKEEAINIVNDLGSEILPDPSEETREKVIVQLAVEIKEHLWTERLDLDGITTYRAPDGHVYALEMENK